jgi:hypothetical protein
MGGDDLEMDDTETAEFDMDGEEEEESDSEEIEMGMMEAINLAKAPAPVTQNLLAPTPKAQMPATVVPKVL